VSDSGKRGDKQVTDAREVRADRAGLDVVQHVDNEVAEGFLSGVVGEPWRSQYKE
jgi:hypothetical protein